MRNPVSRAALAEIVWSRRGRKRIFWPVEIRELAGSFLQAVQVSAAMGGGQRTASRQEDWRRAWPELLAADRSRQLDGHQARRQRGCAGGRGDAGGKSVSRSSPSGRSSGIGIGMSTKSAGEAGRGGPGTRPGHWWLRDIPTAWPLLVMQKAKLGYITDSVIVFERVTGSTLSQRGPERHESGSIGRCCCAARARFCGRSISLGLRHFDAKASNWIVREDEKLGPGRCWWMWMGFASAGGRRWGFRGCCGACAIIRNTRWKIRWRCARDMRHFRRRRSCRRPESRFHLRDEQFSPRRVLIIKPSAIGDIVHALPVLPRLRRRGRTQN